MSTAADKALLKRIAKSSTGEFKVKTPKLGENVFREPYFWNPIDNGSYHGRGNNRIRFDIPREHIWDFETGWFTAEVTLISDGIPVNADPAYIRLGQGSWQVMERVRHLDNLQPIEEIFPYNLIMNFQWVFEQSQTYVQTYGPDLLGIGTRAQRNAWGAITKTYVFPLDMGWISAGPFPAKFINRTQSIEIFLADPNQVIESNMGALNYSLSNCELHAYKLTSKFPGVISDIKLGVSWEDSFEAFVKSGNYQVMLDYWDWYQNQPITNTGDYLIPVKTAAIQGIFSVFGNTLNLTDPLQNDKLLTFPKLNVSQYYLRVFAKIYPEQPVECRDNAIQAYMFYVNWVNAWHINAFPGSDPTNPDPINEVPVNIAEYNSTAFSMIADFRSVRNVPSINPIFSTNDCTSDIRFYLRFDGGAPPVGTVLYHFVRSSTVFGISAEGMPYTLLA